MIYETAIKLQDGEMPDEWYEVPKTKEDLIRLIDTWDEGGPIAKDTPEVERYGWGRTTTGKFIFFAGDEFQDGDEEIENPDYKEFLFDSAEELVERAVVGGKPIWPASKGRRFVPCDAPSPFPIEFLEHLQPRP